MAQFLSSDQWFSHIPEQELNTLLTCSREHDFKHRGLLYLPNDDLTDVYIVKSGEVTLYHLLDGKRIILDIMGEGDLFGSFSTKVTKTSHFAEASGGTRLCKIASKDFLELIRHYPEALLNTITKLSERILTYEHKLALCPAPAKQKILFEIERHAQKSETGSASLTHQKIAQMTGLNRVTVTRGIQELLEESRIELSDDGYSLLAR